MSGIVGMVNLNGAPVDPLLLRRMTEFLTYRGPDDQQTWIAGNVGLGHSLLATTAEAQGESQPCSLDGAVWITADARIDGRSELRAKLEGHRRPGLAEATDAELILHAYHVWGEDCVEHLLGDFSFALWDGRRQRLFAAGDRFAIKPFYYARLGDSLVFSNTLNCVRLHPEVSEELNDLAIADFLLFMVNQDPATTTFADIQTLPGGSALICSADTFAVRRYWTLPEPEEIRYRRGRDYVDHFQELMTTAVADRIRTERAGIFLSGGLDSGTIAAAARDVQARQPSLELRGFTAVHDSLFADQERAYTGQTAAALGIPVEWLSCDELATVPWIDEAEFPTAEPDPHLFSAIYMHQLRQMAGHGRVALDGTGGDETLIPSGSYLLYRLKNRRLGRLVLDVARTLFRHQRRPRVGLMAAGRHYFRRARPLFSYPDWLDPDFARRLDLPGRWKSFAFRSLPVARPRELGRRVLASAVQTRILQVRDPGLTRIPVEVRYPFFDVRLLNFLLALPVLPWCLDKELLRVALRGKVPETVRRRPKAPLRGDVLLEARRRGRLDSLNRPKPAPQLARYVQPSALFPAEGAERSAHEAWMAFLPRKLNTWLQSLKASQLLTSLC